MQRTNNSDDISKIGNLPRNFHYLPYPRGDPVTDGKIRNTMGIDISTRGPTDEFRDEYYVQMSPSVAIYANMVETDHFLLSGNTTLSAISLNLNTTSAKLLVVSGDDCQHTMSHIVYQWRKAKQWVFRRNQRDHIGRQRATTSQVRLTLTEPEDEQAQTPQARMHRQFRVPGGRHPPKNEFLVAPFR